MNKHTIVRWIRTSASQSISKFNFRQRVIYGSAGGATLLLILFIMFGEKGDASTEILISPSKGDFIVSVTTTGELQALNSIEIKGPEQARAVQIWQMKISSIVAEGTVIKKGEFVAELDKSEIIGKLKEAELNMQKFEAQYTQAKLDSTLSLSQARDEMVNLQYTMEEKKIVLEQSTYEAPAIRRQAQIDYERAERTLSQTKNNYFTKTKQAIAKIQAVEADLMKERQRLQI